MKKLLILALLTSCKKIELKDSISDGAKLTKADVGNVYWNPSFKDSLVIRIRSINKDSVYYNSNMKQFNSQLTHHVSYEPKDENLHLYWNGNLYDFRPNY